MDEETLKRNTDCVFFLASPLTCKKGLECEYRHSEIARLNPRDCWYWLAGNCLNPACGFRHPPLDLHVEATHESTVAPCQSFATARKNNMPCFFYYSGFCSKGIGCSFSHGPDWFTPPSAKYLKDSSLVNRRPVPKDNDIARKAIGSSPSSGKLNLSRTFPEAANQSEPASVNMLKLSKLSEISVAEIEVAPAEGSLFPAGPALQRSCISTNQSLEEPVVIERWKASPHLHVFADGNNSENLYYKDNQEEYSLPYMQNEDELNSPSSGYEFEEPPEYDPMTPHAEIFCEYGVGDTWKNSGSSCSPENAGIVQDELLSGERDLLHMELEVGDCPNVDLRDCLRRCRGNGDHSASRLLRTCNSSHSNAYTRIRLGRNQCSQRLHKRSTAFVKKSSAGSPQYCGFSLNGLRKHDFLRHSRVQSFRKHQRKGQLHATRASRYPFSRGRRSSRESADFAGPKTLDQIKEEGMRAESNREDSARCSTMDFPGPKPLNELLKNKTM